MKNERARDLFDNRARLYAKPYHGLTVDGCLLPDLFKSQAESAPTAAMVEAANWLLGLLSAEQRQAASISSPTARAANPPRTAS